MSGLAAGFSGAPQPITFGYCEGFDARSWGCTSTGADRVRARWQWGSRLLCGRCKRAVERAAEPDDRQVDTDGLGS